MLLFAEAVYFAFESFLKRSNASFGEASSWTIFLTALIMGIEWSDCQMFLPMSTPAAPALIDLEVSSSASFSGSLGPPATTIGTAWPT